MKRMRGWQRLAAVYGLVEQMRSVELRVAAGAVDEVQRAAGLEVEFQVAYAARGRVALVEGDRVEYAAAGTSVDYGEARMVRLEEMKVERQAAFEGAVTAHQESRLRLEQIASVMERAAGKAMVEATRRAQAMADDRFAGRAWMKDTGTSHE